MTHDINRDLPDRLTGVDAPEQLHRKRDAEGATLGRRGFLLAAGGLGAAGLVTGIEPTMADSGVSSGAPATNVASTTEDIEPFFGPHQGGILTSPQDHLYFAVFDLTAEKLADVVSLMQAWTEAARLLSEGKPARPFGENPDAPAGDTGEVIDLSPARLTITFGFGPGLFVKDGADRYGLATRRPPALIDLPKFVGDQLVPERSGGDLCVQACANDPQVVFHAVRQLAQIGDGIVKLRWAQTGFARNNATKGTPRNLMGFKDGTSNPPTDNADVMNNVVWAGAEGPAWMQAGSYMVARRIRITLEHWDRMELGFQEQVVGRRKYTGAPLGGKGEFEPLNLDAQDADGNPIIPDNSHVRLAAAATNDGAQILRRGYAYNDGANFYVERWPPWRQGLEYDAGLFFISFQKDPRTSFVPIFKRVAATDAMNQFVTHVGGGIFACPSGATADRFIGQELFAGVVQPTKTASPGATAPNAVTPAAASAIGGSDY